MNGEVDAHIEMRAVWVGHEGKLDKTNPRRRGYQVKVDFYAKEGTDPEWIRLHGQHDGFIEEFKTYDEAFTHMNKLRRDLNLPEMKAVGTT
ncbi:uncharacterized protein METZ01_LOCUS488138 [marine metagenome]|uniref:Uncharacterized protein n=1 Tax=marine metagenome TaxID=408172 RepID=A0A383CT77_9ZZZZ